MTPSSGDPQPPLLLLVSNDEVRGVEKEVRGVEKEDRRLDQEERREEKLAGWREGMAPH